MISRAPDPVATPPPDAMTAQNTITVIMIHCLVRFPRRAIGSLLHTEVVKV
jgi:hypothetical protein